MNSLIKCFLIGILLIVLGSLFLGFTEINQRICGIPIIIGILIIGLGIIRFSDWSPISSEEK